MYIWNLKKLTKKIKNNKLSELDNLKYLVATTTLFYLFYTLEMISPTGYSRIEIYFWIFTALLYIGSLFYFFKQNGGKNGNNFLGKYLAFSFVISVRLFIIFLFILIGLGILLSSLSVHNPNIETFMQNNAFIVFNILYIIFTILYIYLMGKYLAKTKNNQ